MTKYNKAPSAFTGTHGHSKTPTTVRMGRRCAVLATVSKHDFQKEGEVMATVMTWQCSGGDRRSCNGTCHNAKHDKCVCICGGRYHGKSHQPGGVEQAVRDSWEDAIKEAEAKAKAEGVELDTSWIRRMVGVGTVEGKPSGDPVQGTLL